MLSCFYLQVILYKVSTETVGSTDDTCSSKMMKKWVYVGYVRAHTHDVRALTVAIPISWEGLYTVYSHYLLYLSRCIILFLYHTYAYVMLFVVFLNTTFKCFSLI